MKKLITMLTFLFAYSLLFGQVTKASLVEDFERAKTLSLAYLEAMPAEKYSYRPTKEVRSYAEQFLHAAQGTIGLVSNGTSAVRIYAKKNLEKDPDLQSKKQVILIVNESFDFAISSIQEMDAGSFGEIKKSGPFEISKLGWIQKAHEHIAHHRGQAAIYLRMNGIVPPQYTLF